uniref:Uncharacterized protein n=1 Tax=Hyaloperonospora arabidopsidis (strain Emoy2) TaxID=559515 RepID=M4BED4_HYAAE
MDCPETLAKLQAFGDKLHVSFGTHMTQIGVPRDCRPTSHFGSMREKSLRELKEQHIAVCIEKVGTNAVPPDRAHCLLVRVSKAAARMMETTASVDFEGTNATRAVHKEE